MYFGDIYWFIYEGFVGYQNLKFEEEKLTYGQILQSIPQTLIMIEFDIFADLFYFYEQKYNPNKPYLDQAIPNEDIKKFNAEIFAIIKLVKACQQDFLTSGQFNLEMFNTLQTQMEKISDQLGVFNEKEQPFLHDIYNAIRTLMTYIALFLTLPVQYSKPETNTHVENFFAKPKTHSQRHIEHFVQKITQIVSEANDLSLEPVRPLNTS